MSASEVVVVGAGVSGLTTAVTLQERGFRVGIVAAAVSPDTTSDVPAALWYPYRARPLGRVLAWAAATHARLRALAADPGSGVRIRPGIEVFREPAADPWWQEALPSWRRARADELPPGMSDGYAFEAPVVETPIYLPWLRDRFLDAGGTVEVASLQDLRDAAPEGGLLVNCTGLGARALCGDKEVFPSRGQLVQVAPQPLLERFVLDEAQAGAITYVIPRRDCVVLGSTAEDGVESCAADPAATASILARARRLVPALAAAEVLRAVVGLRPCRSEVRLEAERLAGGRLVVHNYGHGGAGFTLSWGCAAEAAELVARARDAEPA